MLKQRRVLAAKIETVEGTAETLDASCGGILVYDVLGLPEIEQIQRKALSASLSKFPNMTGKQSGKITFKAELKGTGAAYSSSVKPLISPYLRACGFAETVDVTPGAEKITYDPASSGAPSLTMGFYDDGLIYKYKGCRGHVKFSGQTGGIVMAEFEFQGVLDSIIDGALLTPTYENVTPPNCLNVPVTLDAYAAVINSFNIDPGIKTALRTDISQASGYRSALITDREMTGKIDPEKVLVAAYDIHGKQKTGALIALTIGPVGATQYNKFTFTAPKAQITAVGDAEREGITVADLTLKFNRNTGDDEIRLVYS